MSSNTRIQELVTKIQIARRQYYDNDTSAEATQPPVTDSVYDEWIEELERLDPSNKELEDVGAAPQTGTWRKKRHPITMGSLTKSKGVEGFKDWYAGLPK